MEYYRGLPLPFYRSCWAVKFMIFQFISVYYSFMECCGGLCLWFYRGWWDVHSGVGLTLAFLCKVVPCRRSHWLSYTLG
jgi:hypothetical protein